MKKLLILLLSILSFQGFSQELGDVPLSPNYGGLVSSAFHQRVLDSGGVYLPNVAAPNIDYLESHGIKPVFSMWAAGVEDGTLFSHIPTDGSGDFTVVNASAAPNKTRINEFGLIEGVAANVALIDYSDGSPVVLTQPASLNEVLYPRSLDNATGWTTTNGTITDGFSSPHVDYSDDGYDFEATSTDATFLLTTPFSGLSTTDWTNSIYVKRITGTGAVSIADITGVYTVIEPTSYWQRFDVTATSTGSGQIGLKLATSGDVIRIAFPQSENLSYATTLMLPVTEGSTASRSGDVITDAGDAATFSEVNESGVFFAEIAALETGYLGNTVKALSLSDGSTSNRVRVSYSNTNEITFRIDNDTDGGIFAAVVNVPSVLGLHKLALRWESDGTYKVYVDGVGIATTSGTVGFNESTLLKLAFNEGDETELFYGKTASIKVLTYKTDAEMIILTTP